MQLRDLIKEIRRKKHWTQVQMAAHLRVSQQNIQGMENAGSNLEKQWAIFLKLRPVCDELGIDAAQDLKVEQAEMEGLRHVQQEIDPDAGSTHKRAKRRRKKAATGAFQTRGIKSS